MRCLGEMMEKGRNLGLKEHKCRVCGMAGSFQSYLAKEMMMGTEDEFEYFVCDNCGCIQISEVPENLGYYYSGEYYSYQFEADEASLSEINIDDNQKILDVGCGSGSWLYEMAKQGCGNLYGCDPFIERDIVYANRVHIRKSDITEMEGDGTFDLIRMGDSFEHVTNPQEVMHNANRLLKDGGQLWIKIPIFPNFLFDMFGTYWYQLDAPRHIFIPSVKTLKLLAENNGFEILRIEYKTTNGCMVRSFLYQHGITYRDQTEEVRKKYFPDETISKVNEICKKEDANRYGDHVDIWMRK